ncbi:MAG: shikimate dehydrogenase [Rhizobiales bacterium]|nr:shikimate dehydrogenase [Hyphomicrobiales bacterium]MBO6699502.1 shikimate dehydrogenase [Hyphomicrobiales bacterium]MBO6737040.1 shikimate dehydrogenase [Hyphomicrobiales bacterium]MBO6911886.1 shikimate dehydrogenase [Hyphomicrobiales bacterium]MBO6954822.1 shikimate dehydrogenase [Hyphomicrobiales bacterium]
MTKHAAVLGWPISHSRSPLIHGTWIAEHGLDATYTAIAVNPESAAAWFADFAGQGLVGANVTIPHKETALAACDHVAEHAARLGAVNTLWLEDGALHGTSTDGEGFLANLADRAPDWAKHPKANTALILGAGGAARAIVDALLISGVDRVLLLNRSLDRADALAAHFARHFGQGRVVAGGLEAFNEHASAAGLLVNTTALGMEGQPPLAIALNHLADGATVTDIVYTPLDTPLLISAHERGHPTVDGLGMLLHQAVPGFERWFGIRPTVTPALRQRVLDDIQAKTKT